MTNASSTYMGILGGVAIGAGISWWIYNRQNKISRKQDDILQRIEKLEEKNGIILTHLEAFAKHHDKIVFSFPSVGVIGIADPSSGRKAFRKGFDMP